MPSPHFVFCYLFCFFLVIYFNLFLNTYFVFFDYKAKLQDKKLKQYYFKIKFLTKIVN